MSGEELKEQIRYFIEHPDLLDTLILDTADWAEKLCQEDVCMKRGVKGIEDVGYGKGYTYMEESWRELLKLLDEVII